MDYLPLSLLADGNLARVGSILGQSDEVHRLRELGFCDGAMVEMVQAGSPCIIRLDGQKLCFRFDSSVNILVHPESRS